MLRFLRFFEVPFSFFLLFDIACKNEIIQTGGMNSV